MAATASITASNTPGPGVSVNQTGRLVSAQTVTSVAGSKFQVAIEGTIDGTNWDRISLVSESGVWTSNEYAFVSVRANLLSVSSGTVTVTFNSI